MPPAISDAEIVEFRRNFRKFCPLSIRLFFVILDLKGAWRIEPWTIGNVMYFFLFLFKIISHTQYYETDLSLRTSVIKAVPTQRAV